jgi:hypothetical protein
MGGRQYELYKHWYRYFRYSLLQSFFNRLFVIIGWATIGIVGWAPIGISKASALLFFVYQPYSTQLNDFFFNCSKPTLTL